MERPITPPDEAVQHWVAQVWHLGIPVQVAASDLHVAKQAAHWGWDQRGAATEAELQQARDEELKGCEEWVAAKISAPEAAELRAARRPTPPSDADIALADLDALVADLSNHGMGFKTTNLRHALERLKELEAAQ